ncbi:IS66-like element accessory protein TnpA [Escherichia coli]|nr:IS66-like element accessory protein TnpA [Escherichia coli]KDW92143.1 transposase family protein [Escherichia coli 2-210-07_S3_C2]
MKHRTWITEALRLHFEEHLPRVVAGRRLGVPKSTVCSMFVRFRRAGLSWPLPAGMSEQELDACLYGQFSTVPVVRPESTVISEAPVVKKRPRRPNFPYEFKIALVEQSLQPGACVAQIARENGINDNLLFNWRHQYRKGGLLPSGKNMPALLPVSASQAAKRPPVVNYPGEGFREMTKAQWAALPRDCKAVRSVAETEDHGAYRYRRTMDNNFRLVNVYITDMKITEIPQK